MVVPERDSPGITASPWTMPPMTASRNVTCRGVAFGPGCFVGADVQIAPGRAIPPGIRLVAPPGTALRKIDDAAAPGTGT